MHLKSIKKFMDKLSRVKESGQTSVEYILLFAVVIIMTLALMQQIKDRIIGDIDNCESNNQSIGCKIKAAFPTGGYERFIRFRIL